MAKSTPPQATHEPGTYTGALVGDPDAPAGPVTRADPATAERAPYRGTPAARRQLAGLAFAARRLARGDAGAAPAVAVVYVTGGDEELTLRRVHQALRELGGDVVRGSVIFTGSLWQAVLTVFKRQAGAGRVESAVGLAVSAGENKLYFETQAAITKTNAEAIATLLDSLGDATIGLVFVGNLLAMKIDGTTVGMELTPRQAAYLRDNPALHRDPAAALEAMERIRVQGA
ncbi:hypothetical protein AB0K18_46050 [Nonomuraea sp. NPDC049421]|uniref:hypothetical protein n=1 Tax=Nonomuraea sp. NPDC049421 TaxID=3155275 RepID=UPI00342AA650